MLASLSGLVVLAFGGMLVTSFRGQLSIASSSATRISVAPKVEHPLAIAVNGSSVSQFDVLRAKFPDLGSLEEHVRASFRTISQLHDLAHSSAPDENRYRCRATVQSIDGEDRWCYLACKSCTRAVAPVDGKFWCDCHDLLDSWDTTYCYKIHLRVSDPTAEATFLLLGYSADAIMPLSAAELRHAFPCDGPNFPPQIEIFAIWSLLLKCSSRGVLVQGLLWTFESIRYLISRVLLASENLAPPENIFQLLLTPLGTAQAGCLAHHLPS